jgi:hypothetical protein
MAVLPIRTEDRWAKIAAPAAEVPRKRQKVTKVIKGLLKV